MNLITFRVPGEPVAWARTTRNIHGFATTPMPQRQFGASVKQFAAAALPPDWQLLEGPVELRVRCVFARPASKCRRKDNPHRRAWSDCRKDADNCAKIVSDNLNLIVWRDDRCVARLVVEKLIGTQGEPPFVEVTITVLEDTSDVVAEHEASLFVSKAQSS
jgi:Holliday junction resolvase RusA-like endonuclease